MSELASYLYTADVRFVSSMRRRASTVIGAVSWIEGAIHSNSDSFLIDGYTFRRQGRGGRRWAEKVMAAGIWIDSTLSLKVNFVFKLLPPSENINSFVTRMFRMFSVGSMNSVFSRIEKKSERYCHKSKNEACTTNIENERGSRIFKTKFNMISFTTLNIKLARRKKI